MRKEMYCLVEAEGADEWVIWYDTEKDAEYSGDVDEAMWEKE